MDWRFDGAGGEGAPTTSGSKRFGTAPHAYRSATSSRRTRLGPNGCGRLRTRTSTTMESVPGAHTHGFSGGLSIVHSGACAEGTLSSVPVPSSLRHREGSD